MQRRKGHLDYFEIGSNVLSQKSLLIVLDNIARLSFPRRRDQVSICMRSAGSALGVYDQSTGGLRISPSLTRIVALYSYHLDNLPHCRRIQRQNLRHLYAVGITTVFANRRVVNVPAAFKNSVFGA